MGRTAARPVQGTQRARLGHHVALCGTSRAACADHQPGQRRRRAADPAARRPVRQDRRRRAAVAGQPRPCRHTARAGRTGDRSRSPHGRDGTGGSGTLGPPAGRCPRRSTRRPPQRAAGKRAVSTHQEAGRRARAVARRAVPHRPALVIKIREAARHAGRTGLIGARGRQEHSGRIGRPLTAHADGYRIRVGGGLRRPHRAGGAAAVGGRGPRGGLRGAGAGVGVPGGAGAAVGARPVVVGHDRPACGLRVGRDAGAADGAGPRS